MIGTIERVDAELDVTTEEREALVQALTRRGFMAAAAAVAALGAGGVAAQSTPTAEAPAAFTYTDATGQGIELAEIPKRIVATSGMLLALWDLGIQAIGCLGAAPSDEDRTTVYARVDVERVTYLVADPTTWEIDMEALVALDPDLVIAEYDAPTSSFFGFGNEQQLTRNVQTFAPLLGFDYTGSVPEVLQRTMDLATALGVSADSEQAHQAVTAFTDAADTVKRAIAANPDLKIGRLSMAEDGSTVSFGKTAGMNDLAYLKELGATIVEGPGDGQWWSDDVSVELLPTFPLDLIVIGIYEDPQVFADSAVYQTLPAVKAGQIGTIKTFPALSHLVYAEVLIAFAELISTSDVVA
ncbi:MAG: ABC transporter substrate-binding protein [Thermomicrobiales bacterium]